MLTVKTFLAADAFGGIGLFAAEDLAAGTLIWKWHSACERVFSREEIDSFAEPFRSFVTKYGYGLADPPGCLVVCSDDGRFMNHSSTPNTVESPPAIIRAARDIAAGEELTCDYHVFDHDLSGGGQFLKQNRADSSL